MRAVVGLFVAITLTSVGAEAAGPWKAQIVDKETGKPISGAVVVAIWTLRSRGEIHPEVKFLSAVEVVSDDDGRFVIPEHTAAPTKPLTAIIGPEVVIFKAGYGTWTFQGGPYYPQAEDTYIRKQRIAAAWEQFARTGVVIELPTLTERRRRLDWTSMVRPLHVPEEKMPRLLDTLDAERVSLGLTRMRPPRTEGQK